LNSTDCDVLVAGSTLSAFAAALAAAETGARTMLLGAADTNDDALLVAVLAEKARRAGMSTASGEIVRIVRHTRRIALVATAAAEIRPRFFVDASTRHGLTSNDLALDGEFVDTMVVGEGPEGRLALPYRAALTDGLDNALRLATNLPEPFAIAAAHAVGTAAALLAASGQPAGDLDPATLREKLRDAGATF